MASSIPAQARTVDPFASYNSDTVNKLTKLATRGKNAIWSRNDLNIVTDSTSPTDHVLVTSGFAFKDEVLIHVTGDHRVDFTDPDHYVSFGSGFNEAGYYYVVLDYTYLKSRPAPQARLKILKPTQTSTPALGLSLLFLKAVKVEFNGISFVIVSFHDVDPGNTDNKREYIDQYFGVETSLPSFEVIRDQGRVVYETETDSFWFGFSDRWGIAGGGGSEVNVDTTGLVVGTIAYTDSNGSAVAAISTDANTGADFVVKQVGVSSNRSGLALLSGYIQGVQVETDIIVNVGDLLYLSDIEAGKVTNVKPERISQVVGRAYTGGNDSVPLEMFFFPRAMFSAAIRGTINTGDWVGPDANGLYYNNINISTLDVDTTSPTVLINVWDATSNYKVEPTEVKLSTGGNSLTIYTSDNTVSWNYMISIGGSGSGGTTGGGGGTTDHDLLFNLDYLSSGHTGFAPSPHGNADHSSTFITASGVTRNNLNANGDVGTGAGQVSAGNHVHTGTELALDGFVNRTKFEWVNGTTITLETARYHHNGTTERIVGWNSTLTFIFGPGGSNAASDSLNGNEWHYLYLDNSEIASATINETDLINSITQPTWSESKLGWYNGNDRCIGAFYTDGANLLREFYHDGRLWQFGENINDLSLQDIDTTWVDATLTIPSFARAAQCIFRIVRPADPVAYMLWRTKGSTSSGNFATPQTKDGGLLLSYDTIRVTTDLNQTIEVKMSVSNSTQGAVYILGWYFPHGM